MGCITSQPKIRNTVLLKTIEEKPYKGDKLEYIFHTDVVPVKLSSRTEGHYRHVADAEQMAELLKDLNAKYQDKYRLLILHHIPPPLQSGTTRTKTEQFQAILYKNRTSEESDEKWTLSVEHVGILGKIIGDAGFSDNAFEVKSNTNHIQNLLNEKSSSGARFITAAVTGSSVYQGFNFSLDGSKPVLQMDFFFEIPSIHNTEFYTYHVEPSTVIRKIVDCATGKRMIFLDCDWVAEFTQNLKKGWKLIDIFADGSSKCRPSAACSEVIKTYLWIWEVPFTEETELVQRYEGAVIEQTAVSSSEDTSSIVEGKAYWESEICKMGDEGWELACIIQNPDVQRYLCQLKFGNILFFQRRIK